MANTLRNRMKETLLVVLAGVVITTSSFAKSGGKGQADTTKSVVLEKCPGSFLPKGSTESNFVLIKAKGISADTKGQFKFTLIGVSKEPGYCMNAPVSGASTEDDLAFDAAQDGFTVTSGGTIAVTTDTEANVATVKVKCSDYGANGIIKVEFKKKGSTSFAGVFEEGSQKNMSTRIPLDDNKNRIPDGTAWDKSTDGSFATGDDTDGIPVGINSPGDNITRYEEYRGFSYDGGHIRTDVNKKEIFIYDVDLLGVGYFGLLGYTVFNKVTPADYFSHLRYMCFNAKYPRQTGLRAGLLRKWQDGDPESNYNTQMANFGTTMVVMFDQMVEANASPVFIQRVISHELGHSVGFGADIPTTDALHGGKEVKNENGVIVGYAKHRNCIMDTPPVSNNETKNTYCSKHDLGATWTLGCLESHYIMRPIPAR